MDKFFYSGFLTLFLLPIIAYVLITHKKTIQKKKKLISIMGFIGLFSFLLMMPIAVEWGAWHYDYAKTSDIHIGGELLETCIWQIIVCMLLGIIVDRLAEKQEKRKSK